MSKEGNLTIKGLTTADDGIYQCFVKNKHGEMHADIKLNVSGKTFVLMYFLLPSLAELYI